MSVHTIPIKSTPFYVYLPPLGIPCNCFLFTYTFRSKGNGERLVGQCEISHPVAASITIGTGPGTEPLEPWPPVDDMGEVIMPGNNVMFEAADKENYQPLGSRILRKSKVWEAHIFTIMNRGTIFLGCRLSFRVQGCSTSTLMALRSTPLLTQTLSTILGWRTFLCTHVDRYGLGTGTSCSRWIRISESL